MFFSFHFWLRDMWGRLSGKRRGSRGTTVRHRTRRSRRRRPPSLELLEARVTPISGLTTFASGSFVIDMGQPTQTVANSLRPYGMVYDLVANQHIPVQWAI